MVRYVGVPAPAPNTWGTVQRNALLDGPSLVNLDATIAKVFALPRGARGEFRADMRSIRFGLKVTF